MFDVPINVNTGAVGGGGRGGGSTQGWVKLSYI